jgi:cell wall-associated NlpC family hydrolase
MIAAFPGRAQREPGPSQAPASGTVPGQARDKPVEGWRDCVDAVAASWIGTPFHDHGEVRGAGVDCAKLLKCVFREAGLIPDIAIGHYSPQFYLHQPREEFLAWVMRFAGEIPLERVQPGDVVLYKLGLCFAHGAIVVKPGWPHIIHAHAAGKVVRRAFGSSPHLGLPVLDKKYFTLKQSAQ